MATKQSRPAIDRRLKGETSVEFKGGSKNMQIKKVVRPSTPAPKKPPVPKKGNSKNYNV